ncbi:hypothetical protein B0A48_05978 [Cryoendolithus antarcticus]|uniref:histidine kinase n=1 Tax=Cryoendolithus antarcticus TaxID=1507870 RepID=A0A1V8TCH4_9PEZI|nr:hypothetical protein B0A48_05978 [Cryoendolithus antarcticus]
MERRSICFPQPGTKTILEKGSDGFADALQRMYTTAENDALESLVDLKATLKSLSAEDFWSTATEGISKLLDAEITFVMKRMLVNDHDCAVEMPPLGETGSCLMAAALHYCTLDGSKNTVKETKFHAYGCPCAYMRHDKVFLIPEDLNDFITNNPNDMPFPAEAYIAVPLFIDGKCVGHCGAMWSKPGVERKQLSWAFVEMLLHSLEDMMVQRLIEGANFIKQVPPPAEKPRVIPHEVVTAAQSLRPYAGSLSHELRTPMQGVVGMLDVMYATVHEAVATSSDPHLRKIFQNLIENIEVVQDSSRRAVEAADNVVHAYDMDMSVPDAPINLPNDDSLDGASPFSLPATERRPEILVVGSNLPLARPNKRRREESRHTSNASRAKVPRIEETDAAWCQELMEDGVYDSDVSPTHTNGHHAEAALAATMQNSKFPPLAQPPVSRSIAPGMRHTNIREVLRYVITDGLKVGGRPDSATASETMHGESIEVRTRGSDGTASRKVIEWSVDPHLPETIFMDEKDLTKLVSCVFLNAHKFTDHNDGLIGVHAKMSSRGRYMSIRVSDNGPGIPAAFLPKLFKPFTQENGSLTRQSDGLGLGLMVAKGIARKLGGDLTCERANTDGPQHGAEFEVRVPIRAGEIISRPSSPFGSPMPRRSNGTTSEGVSSPAYPQAPTSPRRLSRALEAVIQNETTPTNGSHTHRARSPTSPRGSQHRLNVPEHPTAAPPPSHTAPKPRPRKVSAPEIDRNLAQKYPLTFLVAEDNKINRKLLVSMLSKFGYTAIHEAHDGAEAVKQMSIPRTEGKSVDIILMDLWMPLMDGYEATERILGMGLEEVGKVPTVLAVTADVTDGALERAARVGMKGYMTKPFKLLDLQRLITEFCVRSQAESESERGWED